MQIFNPENRVFAEIQRLLDIVTLGIVWLACCCTIVLSGPASAALYYALVKAVRRERSHALHEFWHALRINMKRGVLLTLIFLVFGVLIFRPDYPSLVLMLDKKLEPQMLYLLALLFKYFFFLGMISWVFPLLSRFDIGIFRLIFLSFQTMLAQLPRTLMAVLLCSIGIFLCVAMPILVFVLPGTMAYLMSFVLEPILKRFCLEQEQIDEGKDYWYLE